MAIKVEITEYGEREWVSADAMDRQVQLREAAEQQRDRLLEAIDKHLAAREGDRLYAHDFALYAKAEEIEKERKS